MASNSHPFTATLGSRSYLDLDLPPLPNGSAMTLPLVVLRGTAPGPTGWISAAIHGDEINGTQVARRLLAHLDPTRMAGTLLIVPIVDVYGFNSQSRYLPDRRDLNRSFPGSATGSLAAQLAHLFLHQIVEHCDFGIDLHTGSDGRTNLPQTRGDIADPAFMEMATTFGAPAIVASAAIAGSLRQACAQRQIKYLIYEGGQAGRFDHDAIEAGYTGCLRTLAAEGITTDDDLAPGINLRVVASKHWIRAPHSGVFVAECELGETVAKGARLGIVGDCIGQASEVVTADLDGLVIGLTLDPLVEAGDAVVHLGYQVNE